MKYADIPSWRQWKSDSSSFLQWRSSKPYLVRIDKLIQEYHLSAPMSQKNILVELKDSLQQWAADKLDRQVGSGRLAAMQALADIVLRKLDQFDRWGSHRYDDVVCIGFRVQTGQFEVIAGEHRVKYRGYNSSDLNKLDSDNTIDIRGRTTTMINAIRAAHRQYQVSLGALATAAQEKKRLKLFMAPEFFFRGAHGAYNIEKLWDVADAMRIVTKDPAFNDWLFVLGTVVCHTVKTDGSLNPQGIVLDNFALVQKGGVAQSDGMHDFFVEKEYISHIDYKRPTGGGPGTNWQSSDRKVFVNSQQQTALPPEGSKDIGATKAAENVRERRDGCVFTMDGITFGLEVCLDHLKGRLAAAPDRAGVQIQLIPSAGASIKNPACVNGGIIFNVDGGAPAVDLQVLGGVAPARAASIGVATNPKYFPAAGKVLIFHPIPIPYPNAARPDVARLLKVQKGNLDGVSPVPPPRPA